MDSDRVELKLKIITMNTPRSFDDFWMDLDPLDPRADGTYRMILATLYMSVRLSKVGLSVNVTRGDSGDLVVCNILDKIANHLKIVPN